MIKKLWFQLIFIIVVSLVVGFTVNYFSKSPLPVFQSYIPDTQTDRETGEDLSVYYQEMDAPTLEALQKTDMMILLDARTPDKYLAGHIPGAISLPITHFKETYEKLASQLTADKTLVLYCIGRDCMDSSLLAKELYNHGYHDIYVYKGGMEEWLSLGFPIETPHGLLNPGTPGEQEQKHETKNN